MHIYICMHTYIQEEITSQKKKSMPERTEKYIYIYIYTYIYKLGATHALDECTSGGKKAGEKKAGKKKSMPERTEKYIYIYTYIHIYISSVPHMLLTSALQEEIRKKKAGKKKAFLSAPCGNHL